MKILNKAANSDRVVPPGHLYELENFEDKTKPGQVLQFIEKEPQPGDEVTRALPFQTVCDGTTNEEVLAVLIDRLQVLGARLPSRENSLAVTKLQEALMWLNQRTADRKARNVEGTGGK